MNNLDLKGGALIIGSLLWQVHKEVKDRKRVNWRIDHLIRNIKISVQVPIRYGRYSGGKIYTMVLSKDCVENGDLGVGYVKPFKKGVFNNWTEIESETLEMAKVEGLPKFKGLERGTDIIWCTMGILFNPKISNEKKDYISEKWIDRIIADGGGTDLKEYKLGGLEHSALTDKGILNLDWFDVVREEDQERLDKIDFIICAVTKPQHENLDDDYPSVEEIATSVKQDKNRKYFKNNVLKGITTFQDNRIIELITNR